MLASRPLVTGGTLGVDGARHPRRDGKDGRKVVVGTVKWFSNEKGYGFLSTAEGEDVFVHFSAIEMEGYKSLTQGQEVEFEVTDGPKGKQASNVRATSPA